jgi:hypothetical protein
MRNSRSCGRTAVGSADKPTRVRGVQPSVAHIHLTANRTDHAVLLDVTSYSLVQVLLPSSGSYSEPYSLLDAHFLIFVSLIY